MIGKYNSEIAVQLTMGRERKKHYANASPTKWQTLKGLTGANAPTLVETGAFWSFPRPGHTLSPFSTHSLLYFKADFGE